MTSTKSRGKIPSAPFLNKLPCHHRSSTIWKTFTSSFSRKPKSPSCSPVHETVVLAKNGIGGTDMDYWCIKSRFRIVGANADTVESRTLLERLEAESLRRKQATEWQHLRTRRKLREPCLNAARVSRFYVQFSRCGRYINKCQHSREVGHVPL